MRPKAAPKKAAAAAPAAAASTGGAPRPVLGAKMAANAGAGGPPAGGKGKGKTVEEIYQKKTQLEHILLRPDTYIGSVEKTTQRMWVKDPGSAGLVERECSFVPGLYKIFDEILVNAADNKSRDASMSALRVTIDAAANTISVWNNGAAARLAAGFASCGRIVACCELRGRVLQTNSRSFIHSCSSARRPRHPRRRARGARRVRPRAHLWPPPHVLQLRRRGEEG